MGDSDADGYVCAASVTAHGERGGSFELLDSAAHTRQNGDRIKTNVAADGTRHGEHMKGVTQKVKADGTQIPFAVVTAPSDRGGASSSCKSCLEPESSQSLLWPTLVTSFESL